jgi:hypothetical protein
MSYNHWLKVLEMLFGKHVIAITEIPSACSSILLHFLILSEIQMGNKINRKFVLPKQLVFLFENGRIKIYHFNFEVESVNICEIFWEFSNRFNEQTTFLFFLLSTHVVAKNVMTPKMAKCKIKQNEKNPRQCRFIITLDRCC